MSDPFIITGIHHHHTNVCEPNKNQFVLIRASSGDYSKFSLLMMEDLMAIINPKTHFDSDVIRALLLRICLHRKYKSKHEISNARIRCKMFQQ